MRYIFIIVMLLCGLLFNSVFAQNLIVGKSTLNTQPVIEFKKINSAKYRVFVHGAKDEFTLVMSVSYHKGWELFLKKIEPYKSVQQLLGLLSEYKALKNHEGLQAKKDELTDYIQNGYVTDLGDLTEKTQQYHQQQDGKNTIIFVSIYNIDYISKNNYNSIQNNNLKDGSLFETLICGLYNNDCEKIDMMNHIVANSYANSWFLDIKKICTENQGFCKLNPNGTYDLEFVIEHKGQKLFYLGIILSSVSVGFVVLFLMYLGISKLVKRSKIKPEDISNHESNHEPNHKGNHESDHN